MTKNSELVPNPRSFCKYTSQFINIFERVYYDKLFGYFKNVLSVLLAAFRKNTAVSMFPQSSSKTVKQHSIAKNMWVSF